MIKTPTQNARVKVLENFEGAQQSANDQGNKNKVQERTLLNAEWFPFEGEPDADEEDGEQGRDRPPGCLPEGGAARFIRAARSAIAPSFWRIGGLRMAAWMRLRRTRTR